MKKIILFINFVFIPLAIWANAAQPGIWRAGGTGTFNLLFEEDTAFYKKIQMKQEQVSIQLYKGFAVVKGEYWMYNHEDTSIVMRAGYPINADFESHKNGSDLTAIWFDEMYQFKVLIDGDEMDYEKVEVEEVNSEFVDNYSAKQWYVWKNEFKPKALTKIEVFFILNTNEANVREGYDTRSFNAFIYILETGATWKNPIEKGLIKIQLMDGMSNEDIKGYASDLNLSYNSAQNILYTQFTDLIPTRSDNIALTYHKQIDEFDFNNIINNKDKYYNDIDRLSKTQLNNSNLTEILKFDSPFDIPNTSTNIIGGVFIFMIYGVPILIGLIVIFVLYWIFIRKKK